MEILPYNSNGEDGEYQEGSGNTCEPEYTKGGLEKLGIKTYESDDN